MFIPTATRRLPLLPGFAASASASAQAGDAATTFVDTKASTPINLGVNSSSSDDLPQVTVAAVSNQPSTAAGGVTHTARGAARINLGAGNLACWSAKGITNAQPFDNMTIHLSRLSASSDSGFNYVGAANYV